MVDYQRVSRLPCFFNFSGESKIKFFRVSALNDVIRRLCVPPSYQPFSTSFQLLRLHSRCHNEISCPSQMNVFPLVVLVVLLFKMGRDFHMGILVKDGHSIWYYRELCYCHVNIHLLKFMIGFTLFVMSLTCHVRANPFFIIFCFVSVRIIFAKCLCSFFVLL